MPPLLCAGSWLSRHGLGPVYLEAGPAPAGPRSLDGSALAHRLLHLPVTPIPPFHRVRRRSQQLLVQEHQRLLQARREQLLQRRLQSPEPSQSNPQPGQLGQSGRRPAPATIEEPVDLFHQTTQTAELRLTACDPHQGLPLGGRQMMSHEQVAVLEQIADLAFDPLLASGGESRRLRGGTTSRQLRGLARQALAQFGHGTEHRLGDFLEDVECAELVRNLAEDGGDRLGIQRRAVGRDPLEGQAARLQGRVESAEERLDVLVGRVVIEDLVEEPLEGAVVDDREDAEGTVIQLVGSDVAREVRQGPAEIIGVDPSRRLFPPRPRPSSGSWRRGRTHDVLARGSSWPSDTASHPQ